MKRKILMVAGAVLIVIVTGAITVYVLDRITPQAVPKTATNSNTEPTKATPTAEEIAAKAAEAEKAKIAEQDTTVKNLVGSILQEILNYSSNNRGAFIKTDAELAQFTKTYLKETNLTNPVTNTPYQVALSPAKVSSSVIGYQLGFMCSTTDSSLAPTAASTPRQYALTTVLPSGVNYCLSV